MRAVTVGDSERFCWIEVSVSAGTSALTPMEPNVRQVVVRVSAHVGTRVCPCGNHMTSIGLSSLMQVTPSLVRLTEALVVQPTQVLDSVEERTPGSWGLALGTPERLPSDRPHTDSNGVLACSWSWSWESANPNPNLTPHSHSQPSEAKRSRVVP
ncbi:MAG: hypothetical protein J07HQW1_03623 [Haloquadratum walsbyi J07HQW1]|uniref:Uncharacterized protein n=1 Tax=Haloquadratum walsbyi J07HQW1 TaxID=1238424 RepID=U1MTG7_9EURY|nr:MAG: hypothetical protein J07HQW1_03623 [Haloquadratum walsbyi J07HQW1]